jgi:hypothetical protein
MHRLRPPAPSERSAGAAAVEFALLFPLFILIVFGVIDMGFAFNQKINLTQASREGSRYGATLSIKASHVTSSGTPDGTVDTWLTNVLAVVKSAGGSDLDKGRANRYICVAYIVGGTSRKAVATTSDTATLSNGSCLTDGRTDDRVQVDTRADTALDFLLFGGKITIGSDSVTHFEAAP